MGNLQKLLMEYGKEIEKREKKHLLEEQKTKADIIKRFISKETIATIVGALLRIILVIAYVGAMIKGWTIPEVLTNVFLLILGYFFGQTSTK